MANMAHRKRKSDSRYFGRQELNFSIRNQRRTRRSITFDFLSGHLTLFFKLSIKFSLSEKGISWEGNGSELLDEAVKLARRGGVIEMHVDTKFENAVKFYRK